MNRAVALGLSVILAGSSTAGDESPAGREKTQAPSATGTVSPPPAVVITRDDKVTITIEGTTIKVKPMHALLRRDDDALKWDVHGLAANQSVEVDFEVAVGKPKDNPVKHVKGPFPASGANANPLRGRYLFTTATTFPYVTNVSDAAGYWKYTVVLRSGTQDVAYLDPGVIVKNDW